MKSKILRLNLSSSLFQASFATMPDEKQGFIPRSGSKIPMVLAGLKG
ncbi:MAG TPA: hypothetical protein PKZ42_15100 [Syntrophales bacterium]|nr:hypothetical protein [Syntrophales bacterium]